MVSVVMLLVSLLELVLVKPQSVVEKYDYDGTPLWGTVVKFDGEAVSLKDIGVTSDGNVIAVGDINFDYGYMVKLDSGTGQILWDKTFKSPIYKQVV